MESNAASRFSQLRNQEGAGSRSTAKPALFAALLVVLYLLTSWLGGFWPFGGAPKEESPKPPSGAGEVPAVAPGGGATEAPKIPSPVPKPEPKPEPPAVRNPPPEPPKSPESADAATTAAVAEIAAARATGESDRLRRAMSPKTWDTRFPAPLRAAWLTESRELAKRVVFSGAPMEKSVRIAVKDGDHYVGICARLRKEHGIVATPEFLQKVNDVAPIKLRPGMTLKAPSEPLSILVDKDEFRLYVLLGDCHVLDYTVGLGREERTPEGTFAIQWKTKNPTWTDPNTGKPLQFGEPGHIIGSRWLGFEGPGGVRTGFGIHGTTEPSSIGKSQSDGCVRMLTKDVEELFDLLPSGAPVVVRT